jgi:hypothetical protein
MTNTGRLVLLNSLILSKLPFQISHLRGKETVILMVAAAKVADSGFFQFTKDGLLSLGTTLKSGN